MITLKSIVDRVTYAATGRLPFGNGFTLPVGSMLVNDFQRVRQFITNGYMGNAVIYSIISYSARKFASVPLFVYEIQDEAEFKRYKSLMGGGSPTTGPALIQALKSRKKALTAVSSHPLIDLLKRPNPTQGGSAFFENLYGFKQITGAGTAWVNRGGDPNGDPLELWCLPTQDITIMVNPGDYLEPAGYQLQSGYIANLRKEDVLYWKYWNPYWTQNGSHLYGLAPLEAGGMVANERSKADKVSATMMQNQGSKGVIHAKGEKAMSVETRDRLDSFVDQDINGLRNAGRVALANSELGYLDLGRSALDLGIEQVKRTSKEDLCNVWGLPPVILDPSKGTLANLEASIKSFVTNKIIPEWCGLRDDMNAWLLPMYKNGRRFWIEPDFSAIPEMQEDLQKTVDAVMKIWALTPNQQLEYLGFETDPTDANMNKRYIPANLIPMDQVNAMSGDISGEIKRLNDMGLSDY